MNTVKPIPDGFRTVTPYLIVDDTAKLIDFLQRAFGGEVKFQMTGPDGKVGHSEVLVGDSIVMLGSARPDWKAMPAMIHLYVEDCDAVYAKALAAGAQQVMPLSDQFYGDRSGGVKDSNGNMWWIATHKEDVSEAEMQRRMAAAGKQ